MTPTVHRAHLRAVLHHQGQPAKAPASASSTVYGFVQQIAADRPAESEVGHGTTFRLYFPLLPRSAAETEAVVPALPTPKSVGGGEVILAVDDNAAVRATVAVQLKQLGYTVREADGAQAALQIINGPDKIDLLFTDIVMPGGMNGKQLAIEARRRRPDLPILFTSGFPARPRTTASVSRSTTCC